MGINRDVNRFFGGVGKGFRRFGKQVGSGLKKAGEFIADKALPVIEKVAKGVATGLQYATPALGVLAPELLPFALGAGALAKTIGSAAGGARKAIGIGRNVVRAGEEVVSGIKKGNASKIISGIEKGVSSGSSLMKVGGPVIPPAVLAMRRVAM